eukprot:759009-Hanusia_phi.AAC.3
MEVVGSSSCLRGWRLYELVPVFGDGGETPQLDEEKRGWKLDYCPQSRDAAGRAFRQALDVDTITSSPRGFLTDVSVPMMLIAGCESECSASLLEYLVGRSNCGGGGTEAIMRVVSLVELLPGKDDRGESGGGEVSECCRSSGAHRVGAVQDKRDFERFSCAMDDCWSFDHDDVQQACTRVAPGNSDVSFPGRGCGSTSLVSWRLMAGRGGQKVTPTRGMPR